MSAMNRNSIILEIQNEYVRIDHKWLKLHFHTLLGLVLFGIFVECALSVVLYQTGFVTIPIERYVFKYMFVPVACNLSFLIAGIFAMRLPVLNKHQKAYAISMLFIGVATTFFTIHNIFTSLYLVFAVPILLTVVYGDYILTTVTATMSIAARIVSELFFKWDSDKIHPFSTPYGMIDFFISIAILLAFYFVCVIVIRFEREKNEASILKEIEHEEMQQKLITDELTHIYNRTALRSAFQDLEADETQNTYLFAMIDLDNFKLLNDTLGHDVGDECLRTFGKVLLKHCFDDVTPFRFGGDEFCILFKNNSLEEAMEICKHIQEDFKAHHVNDACHLVTVSIGIASYKQDLTAAELLKITDAALYRSKETKDAICVFEELNIC